MIYYWATVLGLTGHETKARVAVVMRKRQFAYSKQASYETDDPQYQIYEKLRHGRIKMLHEVATRSRAEDIVNVLNAGDYSIKKLWKMKNGFGSPVKLGTRFWAVAHIVGEVQCSLTESHTPHWDPTGETNDKHEILINVCPGVT